MKKIFGILLSLMVVFSMVGCESKEERQAKIVEKVRTKAEETMVQNGTVEGWSYISNKQWSYVEDEEGDYVRLDGTFSYLVSFDISIYFYINEDGTEVIKMKFISPEGVEETDNINPMMKNL